MTERPDLMNNNFFIGPFLFFVTTLAVGVGIIIGATTEGPREKDKTIIYCIDNPDQCKIEYTYLKLKETQNEN